MCLFISCKYILCNCHTTWCRMFHCTACDFIKFVCNLPCNIHIPYIVKWQFLSVQLNKILHASFFRRWNIVSRSLMRIFPVSQVKFLFIWYIQIFRIFLIKKKSWYCRIISRSQVENFSSQSFFSFKWHFTFILNFLSYFSIVVRITYYSYILKWFCGRSQHCRPAYIYKFYFFIKSFICLNFPEERIKIYYYKVYSFNPFFFNCFHMLLIISYGKYSTMYIWMQCLNSSIKHFLKFCNFWNFNYFKSIFFQIFISSSRWYYFYIFFLQKLCKFKYSSFIKNTYQSSFFHFTCSFPISAF